MVQVAWFARTRADLDNIKQVPDGISYNDTEYQLRRQDIARTSLGYKYGQPIPHIEYTASETENWKQIYKGLKSRQLHTIVEYCSGFALLDSILGLGDHIPQLEEVNAFVKGQINFELKPAVGFITWRDFFSGLAVRVFYVTQHIRHESCIAFSPEPDAAHEVMGHMPVMLAPGFADYLQELGLLAVGASDDEIAKLGAIFMYSVEYGLTKQDGNIRVYGGATLSSSGEIDNAFSLNKEKDEKDNKIANNKYRPFDTVDTATLPYDAKHLMPFYCVAESLQDVQEKTLKYVREFKRPFKTRYDATNERIEVFDVEDGVHFETIAGGPSSRNY